AIATPTGFTSEISVVSMVDSGGGGYESVAVYDESQATAGTVASQNAAITTSSTAASTFWGGYYVALAPASGSVSFNLVAATSSGATGSFTPGVTSALSSATSSGAVANIIPGITFAPQRVNASGVE